MLYASKQASVRIESKSPAFRPDELRPDLICSHVTLPRWSTRPRFERPKVKKGKKDRECPPPQGGRMYAVVCLDESRIDCVCGG